MTSGAESERYQRAKRAFFSIADRPAAEWPELLRTECGADDALRQEVESLLGHVDAETDGLRPVLDSEPVELPEEVSGELLAELERELGSQVAHSPRGHEFALNLARLATPRFRPGDVFANRYRMHERLGTGGMGEVWSARDELLGEDVALKFIRERGASGDRGWIERLLAEASLARRITHPNVCRVHDASELEGEFFLSMELVPGSDLARRLREGNRLELQETRSLAIELVDALVAIHSAGLLHRDLKPANILFDEEGAARVSDFGLAAASAEVTESDSPSGTRGYMAPELFAGTPPSEASDVYALGLVLFEAMTNRRAFRTGEQIIVAAAKAELPPAPSLLVPEVDVLLEHIVMRCLAPRPEHRPGSTELQRALAIGDPLEAVMTLGDLPSAEVIASSSSRFLLNRRQAGVTAATFVALISLLVLLTMLGGVHRLPRLSPELAAQRATAIARELGHGQVGSGSHHVFRYQNLKSVHWRPGYELARGVEAGASELEFWYREAPTALAPRLAHTLLNLRGRTQLFDPPRKGGGETTLVLGRDSKLLAFETSLAASDSMERGRETVNWAEVFHLAGQDLEDFEATAALPAEARDSERRLAWSALDSSRRIEAASVGGVVTAFAILEPSQTPSASGGLPPSLYLVNGLLFAALLAFFFPRALRHFRSGLGDPWSSLRMALFCTLAVSCSWLLGADHPTTPSEIFLFLLLGILIGLGVGVLLWILYLAIEPSVQRERPWVLVSWSRFQRGQWSARLVRSHLLLGFTLGLIAPLLLTGLGLVRGATIEIYALNPLLAGSHALGWFSVLLDLPDNTILFGLELLASLTVFRFLLRSEIAALVVTWGIGVVLSYMALGLSPELAIGILFYTLELYALNRIGLLAFVAMVFTSLIFDLFPLAPTLNAWYAGASFFGLAAAVALMLSTAIPLLRESSGADAVPELGSTTPS